MTRGAVERALGWAGAVVVTVAASCAKDRVTITETRGAPLETAPSTSAAHGVACGPRGLPPDRHFIAEGLCARVVAHGQGKLRHVTFANGDLVAVTSDGEIRRYRDVDHDGIFAPEPPETTVWAKNGGDAQACHLDGQDLYCAAAGRIKHWRYTPESGEGGSGDDVVVGIPDGGRRARHALGAWDGFLYVTSGVPAAVKRFALARHTAGRPIRWTDGEPFAGGIADAKALARDPSGRVVAIDDAAVGRPPVALAFAGVEPDAKSALPVKWRGGAFVATEQAVVWARLDGDEPSREVVFGGGRHGTFRDGAWAWRVGEAGDDPVRPTSIAIGPTDGALYVATEGGAIYRIAILGR